VRRGIVCCCALLLILCLTTATSATPKISVNPSFIEASPGENFTIEIRIDPNGAEIYAVQYDLYFNPNILNATSQSQGTLLSKDGATTSVLINKINNTIGKIEYGETRMGVKEGVKEAGVISYISFEVLGTGKSGLNLSNVILSDPNATSIETTIESGIVVVGAPATPATTASPSPAPSPTPTYTDITVEDAYKMYEENPTQITFLDVRTEEEYNAEHILDAVNIPLSELEERIAELDATKKIIVYSQSGKISRDACEILAENGFHAYNQNCYTNLLLPLLLRLHLHFHPHQHRRQHLRRPCCHLRLPLLPPLPYPLLRRLRHSLRKDGNEYRVLKSQLQ